MTEQEGTRESQQPRVPLHTTLGDQRDKEGEDLGVASERERARANERVSDPPPQNKRRGGDKGKGRERKPREKGKRKENPMAGENEQTSGPGKAHSKVDPDLINELKQALGKEKGPGFWSQATDGLGVKMVQAAGQTFAVLCVVGFGYLVKVGVETLFFKDDNAGL